MHSIAIIAIIATIAYISFNQVFMKLLITFYDHGITFCIDSGLRKKIQ